MSIKGKVKWFNPTKGYFLETTFSIGRKNYEDDELTENGTDLKNEQLKFINNFKYFIFNFEYKI